MGNNLLPPIQKEELKNEKISKKVVLILFLIFLGLVILIAIILGLYFYANKKVNFVNNKILMAQEKLKTPQLQEIKSKIDVANQNLSKIAAIKREQVSASIVLEKLISTIPGKIFLKNFLFQNSFKDTEDTETKAVNRIFFAKIKISGIAQDREALLFFKKSLDQSNAFKEVYFEPISWIKPKNADFSVDFKFFP